MAKILVADDEVVITTQLEEHLAYMGYETVGRASSGENAIEMARRLRPDLILMDIVMPGTIDGIDAANVIKTEMDIPVIFLTAYTDDKFIERARSSEPYGYIVKPFHEKEIKAAIEVALYRKLSERQLRESAGSKAVLLDGFFSDIILFLYTKDVRKEHIFKGGIEHGLKNGELCLYAFYTSLLKSYFREEIKDGELRICEMKQGLKRLRKRGLKRLRDFVEGCCAMIERSDEYIAFRFLFDFSEIEDFEDVLAVKEAIIEKRNRAFPISGVFAFDIENLNAERTRVLSEEIPRVIISTGEETTISFSTSSYHPESMDVVSQKVIEEIVRKSAEPLILSFLHRQPMSGYDVIKAIYDKFHVLLPQARVYSLLYELEKREILKVIPRGKSKIYLPTEEGLKHIENKLKDFNVVYSHILGFEG